MAAVALVTSVATTAESLEWPVAEPRLEVSFGERTGGTIARGVRLRSSAATVHAAGDGEAIFVRRSSGAGSLPASLGGMVVVVHAGGLRSAYSGLTPTFDPATNGASVAIGAQLGTMDESAGGPSLLFSLHDAPSRSAVSPANLLPRLEDAPRPVISAVQVVVASAGRYHIEVTAGGEPGAPPPIVRS